MQLHQKIYTLTQKYPLVGPLAWIGSIQYFFIQAIVMAAWTSPFSMMHYPISDLGNTACGAYSSRFVCSPLHTLMNASFIAFGVTMVLGSLFIAYTFPKSRWASIGFVMMALSGLGSILVGVFPENSIKEMHAIGAAFAFLFGNLSIVILGAALSLPKKLKIYTVLSGTISLIALILFSNHTYFGLGEGGMERIISYPQTIWLIIFGFYISRRHTANR